MVKLIHNGWLVIAGMLLLCIWYSPAQAQIDQKKLEEYKRKVKDPNVSREEKMRIAKEMQEMMSNYVNTEQAKAGQTKMEAMANGPCDRGLILDTAIDVSFSFNSTYNRTFKVKGGTNTEHWTVNASGGGKVKGCKGNRRMEIMFRNADAPPGKRMSVSGSDNYHADCPSVEVSSNANGVIKPNDLTFEFSYNNGAASGYVSAGGNGELKYSGRDPLGSGCGGGYSPGLSTTLALNNSRRGIMESCQRVGENGYIYTVNCSQDTTITIAGGVTDRQQLSGTLIIRINCKPLELEAVLKPAPLDAVDYKDWSPAGPVTDGGTGNRIGFVVVLRDKKTKRIFSDKDMRVSYKLENVSTYDGTCMNFKDEKSTTDKDLEFDKSNYEHDPLVNVFRDDYVESKELNGGTFLCVVRSNDFGANGTIRGEAYLNGTTYKAMLEDGKGDSYHIPYDENHNEIADIWETQQGIIGQKYPPEWDNEQKDYEYGGDGIVLFDEYRGLITKGKHYRLSPQVKDYVMYNETGKDLSGKVKLFEKASHWQVWVLKDKELDPNNLIVNLYWTRYNEKNQHAVKATRERLSDLGLSGIAAYCFAKDGTNFSASPDKTARIAIDSFADENDLDYYLAHEMGHTVGLKHHGDELPRISLAYRDSLLIINSFKHYNEAGAIIPPSIFFGGPGDGIKERHSMLANNYGGPMSGDANCIMCYNNDTWWAMPLGFEAHVLVHIDPIKNPYPKPFKFCDSKTSTRKIKFQDTGEEKPLFGDAKEGDCIKKMRLKDW